MGEKHPKAWKLYALYTAAFALLAVLLWGIYAFSGVSFVRKTDGYAQHLPVLNYIGQYLRTFFGQLLQGQFSLPMVDFTIGQGLDVLTTLNYYGLTDPINAIAVFFHEDSMEALYAFLIFLRLYLSGLAFIAYSLYLPSTNRRAVLPGALVYVWSGFALYTAVRHPFFINGMLYLPLLLLGAERYLRKKKGLFFAVVTAMALITNFYFAFADTILLALYLLIRLFVGERQLHFTERIVTILKLIGYYFWGMMMSAAVFFPVVYAFLQNARGSTGGYTASLWHYPKKFYELFIAGFAAPEQNQPYWTNTGFASLAVLAILLLMIRKNIDPESRRTARQLRTGFIVLTLLLWIPLAGKLFNGFGYVSNRWDYGYALLVGLIVVWASPYLLQSGKRERILLVVLTGAYLAVLSVLQLTGKAGQETAVTVTSAICLAFTLLAVNVYAFIKDRRGEDAKSKTERHTAEAGEKAERLRSGTASSGYGLLTGVVMATIAAFLCILYLPQFGDYVSEFVRKGEAMTYIRDTSVQAAEEVVREDQGFYRVEQPWDIGNASMVMGYRGNTYYFSIVPGLFAEYYDGFALNALERTYVLRGQDGRTALNALSATKYATCPEGQEGLIPYGYKKISQSSRADGTVDELFENQLFLPLGYTYDAWLPRKEYESLSPAEKQEALMQCAVLGENPQKTDDRQTEADVQTDVADSATDIQTNVADSATDIQTNVADSGTDIQTVAAVSGTDSSAADPVLPTGAEGISSKTGTDLQLTSMAEDARITRADGVTWKDGILRVREKGAQLELSFSGQKNSETCLYLRGFTYQNTTTDKADITITAQDTVNHMILLGRENNAWYDKPDQTVGLGYSEVPRKTCTLTFSRKGKYTLSALQILYNRMDHFAAWQQQLTRETLTDVRFGANRLTGTITVEQAKLMQLAIPYSSGWHARVDGKEAEILQSNILYMAIPLSPGTHDIVLTYETPFLKIGCIVSLAALLAALSCVFIQRKHVSGERRRLLKADGKS